MTGRLGKIFGVGKGKENQEGEELKRRRADEAKAKELRTKITNQVKDDLWRALSRKDDEHLMFAGAEDLERIWKISRLEQLSKGLDWSDPELLEHAQRYLRRVLSTLVWIGWDDWPKFGRLFLKHYGANNKFDRWDDMLPLHDTSFLATEQLRTFFRNQQYIFAPIVIMEDDDEDDKADYMQFSEKHRLPFLQTEEIGQGGSGTVTKAQIGAGQFCFKNGTTNKAPFLVACKRIPRQRTPGSKVDAGFMAEHKSLKSFKRCLEGNKNIMLSYTAFEHGFDFTIISPLADLDLHTFFEGKYRDFPTRSRGFSPAHLLYGASCLAGALSFLHEGLQPVGISGKIYCAHLDLKPENILVVWNNIEPAGRWMVHDFGTSKIKEKSSPQTLALGDLLRQFSLTQPRRTPGPFQAPEVERAKEKVVGTESDIWSLGCILAVVLSFALGGPSHVTQLFNSRVQDGATEDNDYFYEKKDNKVVLKGKVVRWLDSLITGRRDDMWIKDTLELIYRTLVEKQTARPSAKMIKETLCTIYMMEHMESLHHTCRWAPVELPDVPLASTGAAELIERRRSIESRGDIPRMQVHRPTGLEIEPGLEVVPSSQFSSTRSNSTSQYSDGFSYTIDDYRASGKQVSRSSSTSTRPVNLTEDATFMRYEVPKDTFKAVICYSACHAAFISKKRAMVVRLGDEGIWERSSKPTIINDDSRIRSIDCPDNCEWDFACLSGRYLLLRSRRLASKERRIHKYHCDESGRIWREEQLPDSASFPLSRASNALDISISVRGELLFVCDAELWFHSPQHGYLELFTCGQHRTGSACFSPDGRWIFGWSHQKDNNFYKWDTYTRVRSNTTQTRTLKREWHIPSPLTAPTRPGTGYPAIFSFLDHFVVFDRPDRVYTIGKDTNNPEAVQLPKAVRDIIAGVSIEGAEGGRKVQSLVLLQNNGKGLLMTLPVFSKTTGPPSEGSKLRNQFVSGKDAISVLSTESRFYVVVAHVDGKLERWRTSSS